MTEQHEPVERLAAYAAGDLDATAALEVETHVLLCAGCRADVEALQRVGADLAALPPVAMPADVAARIDAALAAESAGGTDATPELAVLHAAEPAGDILPLRRKRRLPSLSAIAAVAAGVALVGAAGLPYLMGRGDDGRGTALDSAGAPQDTVRIESGLGYSRADARDVLARALSGEQVAGHPSALPAHKDVAAPGAASPESSDALPRTSADRGAAYGFAAREDLAPLRTDAARLAACVDSLATGQPEIGRRPLLVDFGTFERRPALIVVFPTVRQGEIRPDRVDFFVVGPRCGITAGDDDLLFFARFPPPPGL